MYVEHNADRYFSTSEECEGLGEVVKESEEAN